MSTSFIDNVFAEISPEQEQELFKALQNRQKANLEKMKRGFIESIRGIFEQAQAKGFTLTHDDVYFIRSEKQTKASKSDGDAKRIPRFFYLVDGVNYPVQGRMAKELVEKNLTPEQLLKAKVANPAHPAVEANKTALQKAKKEGVVAKKAPAKAPVKVAKKAPVKKGK
ncbi:MULTISPECIES: hypothetical protein [unclassified Rhodanobacter]|uniref:Histone-like protein H-NS C-terminal domain-containing protein n=1 Tax=Rhodanobacter humi TaxID=1888173 RepID=A0ABV4ALH4_9GAMM